MLDDKDSREEQEQLDQIIKPLLDDVREIVSIYPVVAPSLPKELRAIIKNDVLVLNDTEAVLRAIIHSDMGRDELTKTFSSLSRLLSAHTLVGTATGIAFSNKVISKKQFQRVVSANNAKRETSRTITDILTPLVDECIKNHPTWSSNRIAGKIMLQVNDQLGKNNLEALKQNTISKRIKVILKQS